MEKEFLKKAKFFSADYLRCCIYILNNDKVEFTKRLYSKFISTSSLLEDFLDFHGAKNNTHWFYYRELSATVRHISLPAYSQKHILSRLSFYDLEDFEEFKKESEKTEKFFISSIKKLAPAVLEEAKKLGIFPPDDYFYKYDDFMGIDTNYKLEYDITDEDIDLQKKNLVRLASEFLSIAEHFNDFEFYEPYPIEKIKEMVPLVINEAEMRRFEMLTRNMQSSFDTYVNHQGVNVRNKEFRQFRGGFSVILHLLQTIGRISHLYERHFYNMGYKKIYKDVYEKRSNLIDPHELLNIIINYGLYYICFFFSNGKKLVEKILNDNVEKASITVPIPMDRGFHSRPSLLVAKIVKHYGGEVELWVENDKFNAASIVDIQWAGGKIQKEGIKQVIFKGDVRALHDIKILSSVNYGEDIMGKATSLPKELLYLKEK
jgi:phosphotransferase system HPr-like phosphotransfer protein